MAYRGKHVNQPAGKKGKAGKAGLIIMIILLILIIIACAGMIVINSYLNRINRVGDVDVVPPDQAQDEVDDKDVDPTKPVVDDKDVEWWEGDALNDDHLINILLVGQDSRTGARERSDAMILCSINPDTGDVSLISFMRDLYVQMPEGYVDNRMNAAYAFGGFPFLYEVLYKNFGITVDGGMEVNFDGFKNVIDAVGGVDIELTSGEANIVGQGAVAGMNHLNGSQALEYSRIRKIGSDFQRTERQRIVLQSVFNSVKNADLTTLLSLVDTLIPMVTTDMTNTQILSLATKLLPSISSLKLSSYRIPADDAYYGATIRGMSVLVPDLELNRKHLQEEYLPLN